ncbi:unnamed protein product [Rotaria sp. Silwood2]|nr:unnamed protein product [Rotaria sp. Silwood2]CAF4016789.1 unnamed protein product [Rotaria sp. Silwood2]
MPLSIFNESEFRHICANNCLRASFVNRFAQQLSQMDAFICYPLSGKYSNLDQWLAQQCSTKNFERTLFIVNQLKPHVPFLLAFMKTQSFVSFVDIFFSDRIRLYRNSDDLTYQACLSIDLIDKETRRRFTPSYPSSLIVMNAPLVRSLDNSISTSNNCYLFENLNGTLLESSSSSIINISSPLSTRHITRFKKQQTVTTGEHQQHVVLVENEVVFQQLLKECTTKTKRMVIEEMEDIVEGSSPIKNADSSSMVNLEKNVLIAGFCDLLERIWSHGLHHKPNGKSASWNHIKFYVKLKNYELAETSHASLPVTLSKDENPEKKKKELLTSGEQLTRHILDGLNNDVSECYKNQKRIDHACKQLTTQSNLLLKQSQAWITLIGQFTDALKELGDVENYSKIIERECLSITNILATVHQDMTKNRQQTGDNNPQDSSNPTE